MVKSEILINQYILSILMQYVRKTITLKVEHVEWIKVHSINLSRFVQQKIEEEMKKLG